MESQRKLTGKVTTRKGYDRTSKVPPAMIVVELRADHRLTTGSLTRLLQSQGFQNSYHPWISGIPLSNIQFWKPNLWITNNMLSLFFFFKKNHSCPHEGLVVMAASGPALHFVQRSKVFLLPLTTFWATSYILKISLHHFPVPVLAYSMVCSLL